MLAALVLIPSAGSANGDPLLVGVVGNSATANTAFTTTAVFGLSVTDSTPSAVTLFGTNSATTGIGVGVMGSTASAGAGAGVFGRATSSAPNAGAAGVRGQSFSANANGPGVYGLHSQPTGTAPGVLGETNSAVAGAIGIEGFVTSGSPGFSSIGVLGRNNGAGASGFGVEGVQSGSGIGGYFHVPGPGNGVYASAGDGGTGVFGTTALGSSLGYGVWGQSLSTAADSAGVSGAISSNAANAAGVRGINTGINCCGMGVAGFHAGQGIGIYGESLEGFAVSGYSPNNWSGYFQGDVRVVGTLTKTAGAFRIDNPLDPTHSYLQHSFVESPDMMNVYNGNVTTNGKGFATVKLPDWFGALNKDFRYQLTPLGHNGWGARAVVWNEIRNNRFTIRSEPHVKISWQVTGVRHDPYANVHRIQTVVPKGGADGKYVHPRLYGKPMTKSVVVLPGMDGKGHSKFTPRDMK